MSDRLAVVVLAGGLSTRFKSERSKLLYRLAGRPILGWVLEAVKALEPSQTVVVYGPHNDELKSHFQGVDWALQKEPRGTADALLSAMDALSDNITHVFLIGGDSPLVEPDTLRNAWLTAKAATLTTAVALTARVPDPRGYGRVVRYGAMVYRIVEEKDADSASQAIDEINSGMYFLNAYNLRDDLRGVGDSNAAHELYLTDVIGKRRAMAFVVEDYREILGINTRYELAQMEGIVQERLTRRLMEDGVSFIRPETSYVEIGVTIAPDTMVLPGTYLMGTTAIGAGCVLGPDTVIADCDVGDDCTITFSHLHNAKVGNRVKIGPYANIRPDTVLADDVKIGNFVEMKKAVVAEGSKIPHLSYVGDSDVGRGVNIGAGTITCNYDGYQKHKTVIADDVFIGSNSTIIAPRTIARGAYVAAGSVITEDVGENDLAVGRGRQANKRGYAARIRESMRRRAEAARDAGVESRGEQLEGDGGT